METIFKNLEDLWAFHGVALYGGFSKCALELGLSKSQVSKQVQRLEVQLKAKLFIRTTRTIKLTEAGQELMSISSRIRDLTIEADEKIRGLQGGRGGRIRISVPISFGEFLGPSFLRLAQHRLPDVAFDLDLSNEQLDFFTQKIDFAIRAADEHHPDLVARYLGHLKDVVCASPEYLKALKPIRHPKQLGSLQCVLHSLEPSWNTWTLRSHQEEVKVQTHGQFSSNQYSSIKVLCQSGYGIARLPYFIAVDELRTGKLVQLFKEFEMTTHPLYLVYLKQEYTSKRSQIIKLLLLEWFKDHDSIFFKKL